MRHCPSLVPALLLATGLAVAGLPAAAQTTAVPAEKQQLIDQILPLIHPETAVLVQVQRPAADAVEKSRIAMQTTGMGKDRLEKALKDIAADAQKYVDTVTPLAKAAAQKRAGAALSPLLAQAFSADELRQVLAMLQAPVRARFEALGPKLEDALGRQVSADIGPQVNQQIQALNEAVGTKLRAAMMVP